MANKHKILTQAQAREYSRLEMLLMYRNNAEQEKVVNEQNYKYWGLKKLDIEMLNRKKEELIVKHTRNDKELSLNTQKEIYDYVRLNY